MSRIAYATIGKRGTFSRNARYTKPQNAPVEPIDTVDACEKAYRDGFEDGQVAARAAFDEQLASERAGRAAIELAFAQFDSDSEKLLRQRLLATVQALCEEAVLPLAFESEGLARRIDAAANMLTRKHDERRVHINTEDLELVQGKVQPDLVLVPDGNVERGGLRVETEDGGLEDDPKQWRRAIAEMFDSCSN